MSFIINLTNVHSLNVDECDSSSAIEAVIEDIVIEEGLIYIAGYGAYRFRVKYPGLGVKTKNLPPTEQSPLEWIRCISDGHLRYPSDDLVKVTKIVEEEFQKFHGSYLSKEPKIFARLSDIVREKEWIGN